VSVILTVILFFYQWLQGNDYSGANPFILIGVFLLFCTVFVFSRKGYIKFASWSLFVIFLAIAHIIMYKSGYENGASLLLFAWVIVLTGILFEQKHVIYILPLVFADLFLLGYLELNHISLPYLYWKTKELDVLNVFGFIFIMLIIAIISWLYNREIFKSLTRALKSEAELQKERDLLEEKVEQRTKDLKDSQIEQINQLAKFAEYGQSMSGLIHDLINPITAITLNLSQVKYLTDQNKVEETKTYSKSALSAVKKMEELVLSNRDRMRNRPNITKFSVAKELSEMLKFFEIKARKKEIKILTDIDKKIHLKNDKTKFDQMLSNLIANAIDAFDGCQKTDKKIEILVQTFGDHLQITLKDNACGIEQKVIDKIFDPFFTTKDKEKGVGIGLHLTRNAIENDFGGEVSVKSKKGEGTTFYITLPLNIHDKFKN
jgi:signal transduction histidine kinase